MDKIFKRNLTSELISEVLLNLPISATDRVLDLGCGDGNIGLGLAISNKLKKIFGSDVSTHSVKKAIEYAQKSDVLCDYRVGSGLQPWAGERFDVISCDVAAISETIADLSDWYDGISCETGPDGLALVSPLIEKSSNFLVENGYFVIPRISLANQEQLEAKLNLQFREVVTSTEKQWPLPSDLTSKIKRQGLPLVSENWSIKEKFGMLVATTSVSVCKC